jgi:hypothetical protein
MKFGVREICDVVFKAKSAGKIGKYSYGIGQPVLYIDSAKTSTMEGAATTVYATGGKGNNRLVAWEGEKTLTFTVEDALLSPISFSMLAGAGLFEPDENNKAHVHTTRRAIMTTTSAGDVTIDLSMDLAAGEKIDENAPVFVMVEEADGSLSGDFVRELVVDTTTKQKLSGKGVLNSTGEKPDAGNATVFVDFYVEKAIGVQEIVIDEGTFGGYFYVEASTLFRRQIDGKDLAAELVFPNVKIQSNFSFAMSSTGDPSTFTFTMDAFPGYTMFDKTKKVLCAMQVIDDAVTLGSEKIADSVTTDASHAEGIE